MTVPSFQYSEQPACAALSPWILGYWSFSVADLPADATPYTVWPDGCLSLAFIPHDVPGPRVMATGPRVTAMHPPLRPHSLLFGVRLWPDAIRSVTGLPARALRDAVGPAAPELAGRFAALAQRLEACRTLDAACAAFDDALLHNARDWAEPDPQVRRAVKYIVAERGQVEMSAVAAEAHLSLRQLQRRFIDATGLTLREWARVRRLRESLALRLAGAEGWSQVAASAGFADHAHLTREFVTLTGLAPTAAARHLATIRHNNVRP